MEKAKNTYHTVVGTIPKSNIKICIVNDTFDNKMKNPKISHCRDHSKIK